jgi:DNA-binding response OmpR family regulator
MLIIEDEIDIVKMLTKRFTDNKFQVFTARDGYQGIAFTHKEKPDIILLDLMLPAGDGLQVLKAIRLSLNTRLIPVIVLTGKKDEEYKREVMEQGVEAFIEKPYDFHVLLQVVWQALKNRKGR